MNELNSKIQEKIMELIKRNKKELSRIKRDWEYAKEEFNDMVSNQTYNSEYELNNDIRKIRKIINEFGDAYDDFLTALDKDAKNILEQGANHTFVKDIIDLIEEIFEIIDDLSFDFSKHSYSYEISSELNEIQKWWTDKYKNMLKVIKLEREQEERQEREKAEKLKSLDIEFEEWKKEVKEIKRIRSKKLEEYNQKIDEEEKEEKIKCEKNRDKAINDFKIEIEQLKARIDIEQQELDSLGIFKFKRKEELIISIQNLREKIRRKEEDIGWTKNIFLNNINELEKKTVENKANYEIEIRKKYPIIANPEVILRYEKLHGNKSNQGVLTRTCSENMNIKDAIFEELLKQKNPMSITDLMYNSVNVYELAGGSNQKVSALMSQLIEAGRVIRITEGKKVLFTINYDRYMEEFDE